MLITLLTTSHVTECLPSSSRSLEPPQPQPWCQRNWWTSCWTSKQTGHHCNGTNVSGFKQSLAQSTQKSYSAAMKRFHEFCTQYNITAPFPLADQCHITVHAQDPPQTFQMRPVREGGGYRCGSHGVTHMPSLSSAQLYQVTSGRAWAILYEQDKAAGHQVLADQPDPPNSPGPRPSPGRLCWSQLLHWSSYIHSIGRDRGLTIQALGRWQSAAFLQYIRIPREQLVAISTKLSAEALW